MSMLLWHECIGIESVPIYFIHFRCVIGLPHICRTLVRSTSTWPQHDLTDCMYVTGLERVGDLHLHRTLARPHVAMACVGLEQLYFFQPGDCILQDWQGVSVRAQCVSSIYSISCLGLRLDCSTCARCVHTRTHQVKHVRKVFTDVAFFLMCLVLLLSAEF